MYKQAIRLPPPGITNRNGIGGEKGVQAGSDDDVHAGGELVLGNCSGSDGERHRGLLKPLRGRF